MRFAVVVFALALALPAMGDEYIGQLSSNPYAKDSVSNPYGAGNPYSSKSVTNPYGTYGSPYSNQSATNPYATDAPKLYDSDGNYRGKLSSNPYDPESVSNPYGRYGNPYSPDSIKNPYGAGNRYSADSPTNPFGRGLRIVGQKDADTSTRTTSPAFGDRPKAAESFGLKPLEPMKPLEPLKLPTLGFGD